MTRGSGVVGSHLEGLRYTCADSGVLSLGPYFPPHRKGRVYFCLLCKIQLSFVQQKSLTLGSIFCVSLQISPWVGGQETMLVPLPRFELPPGGLRTKTGFRDGRSGGVWVTGGSWSFPPISGLLRPRPQWSRVWTRGAGVCVLRVPTR